MMEKEEFIMKFKDTHHSVLERALLFDLVERTESGSIKWVYCGKYINLGRVMSTYTFETVKGTMSVSLSVDSSSDTALLTICFDRDYEPLIIDSDKDLLESLRNLVENSYDDTSYKMKIIECSLSVLTKS